MFGNGAAPCTAIPPVSCEKYTLNLNDRFAMRSVLRGSQICFIRKIYKEQMKTGAFGGTLTNTHVGTKNSRTHIQIFTSARRDKYYAVPFNILFQYNQGNTFFFSIHIVQRSFA